MSPAPDVRAGSEPGPRWFPVPLPWLLAGLGALALMTTSRVYLSLALKAVAEPFPEILLGETLKWALWLPVIPVIVTLDRARGFGRSSLSGALALHVPAAAAVLALHTVIMTAAGQSAGWYFALETARATAVIRLVHEGTTVLLVYGAIVALDHVRRHRVERERSRVAESRLEAQLATERLRNLQAQLHPHFLFNALHAVAGLLREGDREDAVETVTELAELLRVSLRRADRQRVALVEELGFLEAYLDVLKARYGERLEVEWHVAPEVTDALVPHLILQPLVENAVQHGVETTLSADASGAAVGRIEIHAERMGDRLVLRVVDNGPGGETEAEGVGLSNTRERLETLYGSAAELSVSSDDGRGTTAQVTLPLQREEPS